MRSPNKKITCKSFFIAGTDTGIGKTFVTAKIAKALSEGGCRVAVMKPIQTGLSEPDSDDLHKIKKTAPQILDIPLELASPYRFDLPASPHLAAQKSHVHIDMNKIAYCKDRILQDYKPDFLLVEGAGGLLVPLNEKDMMIDLMKKLKMPVVLVARARLGTLNHTFLSVEAIYKRKIALAGIIMNFMPGDIFQIATDNIATVSKRLRNVKIGVAGALKDINDSDNKNMIKIFWNE